MKTAISYFFILLSLAGCNTQIYKPVPDLFADTSTYLRVYEYPNSTVTLNGRLVSIDELDRRFLHLVNDGIVFYSCAQATNIPPSNSAVIDLIKKYRVSIKMFSDSSFTKALD